MYGGYKLLCTNAYCTKICFGDVMGFTQFDCFSVQVNQWLNQIGEGTLVGHGDMGSNLAAARDFLEVHERLHDDLMERSDEVKALSRVAEDLAKAGDKVRA